MRNITSVRMACCLPLLLAGLAVPAAAAVQLDSGTGLQASREVANPPPPANSRPGATRSGPAAGKSRMSQAQAARRNTPASAGSGSGKNSPP